MFFSKHYRHILCVRGEDGFCMFSRPKHFALCVPSGNQEQFIAHCVLNQEQFVGI